MEEMPETGCYRTTGFVNVSLPSQLTFHQDKLKVWIWKMLVRIEVANYAVSKPDIKCIRYID